MNSKDKDEGNDSSSSLPKPPVMSEDANVAIPVVSSLIQEAAALPHSPPQVSPYAMADLEGSYTSSYTDESEADTPFFSPANDQSRRGMQRYVTDAPHTPSAREASHLVQPPVTPQEKWALKKFLSAPFLNKQEAQEDEEQSDFNDSMQYSFDSSKMSGGFSAAGSLFSLETYKDTSTNEGSQTSLELVEQDTCSNRSIQANHGGRTRQNATNQPPSSLRFFRNGPANGSRRGV